MEIGLLLAGRRLAGPELPIATGLARYGHKDLAANIADKTIANALKNGVSEHYDAVSGKPLGVTFLGMSCTIATMMLDGLSRKYSVRLKKRGEDEG